jgi:hypothetical protein
MEDKRARLKRLSYSRNSSLELERKNCSDTILKAPSPKISPRWVIERTSMLQLDTKYSELIKILKSELATFEQVRNKTHWKDILNDDIIPINFKLKLANFREKLLNILSNICEEDSLHDSFLYSCGSTKMDSDLDISVAGCRFFTNVKALMTVSGFINKINIFESDTYFYNFFDMHFYLSNFGIIRNDNYVISTDYETQMMYAFMKHKDFDKQAYFDLAFRIAQNMYSSENTIINLLSQLSLYENDSYKTQGAFFHVVLLLQQGRENLPITDEMFMISCIENLCFAYKHFEYRRDKYISRAFDALDRIKKPCKNVTKQQVHACAYNKTKLGELIATLDRNNTPILFL